MKMSASSSLPRIGLGMAALGRPGYINLDRNNIFGSDSRSLETMQKQANLVMDALFQSTDTTTTSTVPWIDCARSYGLSEKFVGEYLKEKNISPDKVYVSSKWGYTYVADWKVKLDEGAPHEVKDHSVENFLKQLEETKSYIGEYVKLYQIHSATFESGVLDNKDVHAALHQCRKDLGWAIGLSVSSPKQNEILQCAMNININDDDDDDNGSCKLFDSVQCTYNMFEQKPGDALLEAHKAGMDIIIKEGLANGRILRNPIVNKYAEQLSCTADQLALGFILAQPFQPRVLSGAVTPDQLISNLKATEIAEKLRNDPELLKEIMESTVMDSDEYWNERSSLAWN